MTVSRRIFLKNGSMALVGFGAFPSWLGRAVASSELPSHQTLVVIFLRGGADGLNMVIPYGESDYYRKRSSISIARPGKSGGALDLDGFFGFHPSLAEIHPLFSRGELAVIQAVGSPSSSRSHFDAQDFMESAAPDNRSVRDGWLNRFLQSGPGPQGHFRGLGVGKSLPRSLAGAAPAIALEDLQRFDLRAGTSQSAVRSGYQDLYSAEEDTLLSGTAGDLFEAIEYLRKADLGRTRPSRVRYPRGALGTNLSQLAQMIKAGLGVQVACIDSPGWDHHFNQGGERGQQSNLLRQLGQSLSAFQEDLGQTAERVLTLTMSEFGRTLAENGSGGTDHGHANLMLALGPVKGGKVYGRWPGLAKRDLFEGRDLAATTDFRDVFAEILTQHLGTSDVSSILPGFEPTPHRYHRFVS